MPVETTISDKDYPLILANYNLGEYRGSKTFANGKGQTTVLLETTQGKFVLKYYEDRSEKHVQFEINLFAYLQTRNYPVPKIIQNTTGEFLSVYKNKPYLILEFIGGSHGTNPNESFNEAKAAEVIKATAELHNLTKDYNPQYFADREPFDVEYCWREFKRKHPHLAEDEKGKWLKNELDKLEFPSSLPKGLNHADLNYGNFLFRDGKIVAVLDFDMSFYGPLVYDIANLIYWWAWPPGEDMKSQASQIVREYQKWRELSQEEKWYIYDALKLILLIDASWSEENEFENSRSGINFLNSLGREGFYKSLDYLE